jgi:hypothetical protein
LAERPFLPLAYNPRYQATNAEKRLVFATNAPKVAKYSRRRMMFGAAPQQ